MPSHHSIDSLWKHPIDLTSVNARGKNTMVEHLGIIFTEIGENYMIASMPIDHRTHQPLGIMHGAASCVLAETVGSTAANYAVDLNKYYCVGLDINTNHIRSIREGIVFGKAVPFHIGKSTHVWGIEIKNEQGQIISVNRLTMAVLNKVAYQVE